MAQLTQRYQDALARLRAQATTMVGAAWDSLERYDEAQVSEWLDLVEPVVLAGQAQAVALTDAYLAALLERAPLGLLPEELTGAAVRAGTTPAEVYRRPFVTVWTALAAGTAWAAATSAGRAQATTSAATDIALSTRAAASAAGELDDSITGFARVPDGNACEFCTSAAGQRYRTDDLMPLHPNCGCTLEPLTTGLAPRAHPEPPEPATVEEHGELGPVLVGADDHFAELGG